MENFNYLDNFMLKDYKEISSVNFFEDKKLKVEEIKNGIILPVFKTNQYNTSKGAGGVVDNNLNYIESSALLAHNMKNRVYGKYEFDKNEIDYIDETVMYVNFFYEHWGHYIIEIVSRLWYLLDKFKREKIKIVFTGILNDKNTKITGNYLEFLKLFGIEEDKILIINKPTKFKYVIVPECSIFPGKYYTKEYIEIFEQVSKNVTIGEDIPSKIYLSRLNFNKAKSKEIGEKDIEKFFNNNGYVSISPELFSLSKQIQYFRDSEEIVCISGTLPHNILFANNEKKIIIINKTYKLNKHQELINQAKNANVIYLDLHISFFPIAYGKGPFILTLNNNFKKFANDRNYIIKKDWTFLIKNIYKKIWYFKKYLKIYNFKIYSDEEIDWKKIFKYYIFK